MPTPDSLAPHAGLHEERIQMGLNSISVSIQSVLDPKQSVASGRFLESHPTAKEIGPKDFKYVTTQSKHRLRP
jgi:hypothetical protein